MNPLSGLYGAAMALRNTLFDRRLLRSRRLRQPVISVGNLSAGGSGKTPFVIALGELLQARGIALDVLSRGYGRATRGVRIVDPAGSASDFGDEPLLIARKLGVPVIVGESRYAAGQAAEENFHCQMHILDDGFQHRSLARDFEIVLVTARDLGDTLLPWGRLREPFSSLARADAIVVPRAFSEADVDKVLEAGGRGPQGPRPSKPSACRSGGPPDHPESMTGSPGKLFWRMSRGLAVDIAPASPVVFCGIARPEQFFAQVRGAGMQPVAEIVFRDHKAYTGRDVDRLRATRDRLGASGFVTTEKDAINLGPLQSQLTPLAVAVLTVALDRPADLVDAILSRIGDRKPRS